MLYNIHPVRARFDADQADRVSGVTFLIKRNLARLPEARKLRNNRPREFDGEWNALRVIPFWAKIKTLMQIEKEHMPA